jgi:hypothetical protein
MTGTLSLKVHNSGTTGQAGPLSHLLSTQLYKSSTASVTAARLWQQSQHTWITCMANTLCCAACCFLLAAVAIAGAAMEELEARQQQHLQRRQQLVSNSVRRKWDMLPTAKALHQNKQQELQQHEVDQQQQQDCFSSCHYTATAPASAFERLVDRNVEASMQLRQQQLLDRQQQWWQAHHHELQQQEFQQQQQQQ